MWGTSAVYYSGMKWHLADPLSVEEYTEPHPWKPDKTVNKMRVRIQCSPSGYDNHLINDARIRETLPLTQANVCAYCKKARMRQYGMDDYEI